MLTTCSCLPRWRFRLADRIARGALASTRAELRTAQARLEETQLRFARALGADPDRAAAVTLGAVLHRATRRDGQATIQVPEPVLDRWLDQHAQIGQARAAALADVPMPEVAPGPADPTAVRTTNLAEAAL